MATGTADERRTVYRTCPLCEATCGLELTVEGERVTRVRGDREDVLSGGYLCPKGVALGELHHDPDRLRAPLVRDGDGLREASWEEAFERVAAGLAPFLAENPRRALGIYVGNPNVHNLGGALFLRPLLKALATRHLYTASTVDQMPKHVASGLMFGDPAALPVPDVDRCDYLLMLGANPWESNGSLWTAPDLPRRLRALRRRGGRLVVVDPRRTRTAEHADLHLAIRPGSDAPWLLALAHVIVDEGLARPGRLADFSEGLDGLAARLAAFTPEAVAAQCDIDAATTRAVARELAAASRAAVYARIGTHANPFGTLAAWATELLNLLTGNLDREGGVMFPRAPHDRPDDGEPGGRGFTTGRWRSRVSAHPEFGGELPVAALAEEIETPGEGQLRALITIAGNPVLSTPDGAALDRALASLDFMVSVDIYRNETTRHADVILPAPPILAKGHYDLALYQLAIRNVANYSPPVRDLAPGEMAEWEILIRLGAVAMGLGTEVDVDALDAMITRQLVDKAVGRAGSNVEGRDADELMGALADRRGPEKALDFMLRNGPYGDGFGADPTGLSLAVL
ncbi:MAG: molybdopterin-dependent oxidoreductase, partial [Planctomycetes bacterium]|nr:molybdopterin-dependent oxidoreductase [Planctomycetota bacterium]